MGTFGGSAGNGLLGVWEGRQSHSNTPSDGVPSLPVSENGRPIKGVAGNPSLGEEGHEAGAGGRRMARACGTWSTGWVLMCRVLQRLTGPEASPQVPAVSVGAPSV